MILEVSLQGVNSGTLATLTFNTPAEVYWTIEQYLRS